MSVRDQMGKEFKSLYDIDHKQLFDLLFDLMKSYRSTWKTERIYPLIYQLLFNVLLTCYDKIHKYETSVSSTLCKKFSINKSILYQSFYNEWIKNSNFEIFLSSTDEIAQIKDYIIDTMFVKEFISKHLQLEYHQISEEIHLKFASFIQKCINISWKMVVQHPLLRFTPNTFNVEQLNKIKYHKDLHDVCYTNGDKQYDYILYYIWPIISHNNFHSIVDYMKIQVCLGDSLQHEDDDVDEYEDDASEVIDDEEDDDVGMMIFTHDDNNDNYDYY